MPDSLDIRTLARKNVKSLILGPKPQVQALLNPEVVQWRDPKEELDSLEVVVDFELDLMPEDFELKDLIPLRRILDGGSSSEVSLVKHGTSGVVMAKRVSSSFIPILHGY